MKNHLMHKSPRTLQICWVLLTLFICSTLQSQDLNPVYKKIHLGDQVVQLKIYQKPGKNVTYAHVHENEEASLAAGLRMVGKYGGKLITLAHSTDGKTNRNVSFSYKKTVYKFDPNRIYTQDLNVLKNSISVVKGKGKVDDEIIKMVKNLADQVWMELADSPFILALHNNKNTPAEYKMRWLFWKHIEPESYNIKSYIKSQDQSSDSNKSCADIYINPALNNSEFFIVTQREDFNMLVKKRYTVVLQNDKPVDDGSMSVFASGFGKRYINAEAKLGRIEEQTTMLEILLRD